MQLGYTNVKIYNGGLPDWIRRRFPVIRTVEYPKINILKIYPEQVYKKINDVVILDIGGEALHRIGTFQQGDVAHIPIDDLDEKYSVLPKDKKIIIVDVMGKQEEIAGRFLTMKGFKNLAVMAGGGRAWFNMLRVKAMEKRDGVRNKKVQKEMKKE